MWNPNRRARYASALPQAERSIEGRAPLKHAARPGDPWTPDWIVEGRRHRVVTLSTLADAYCLDALCGEAFGKWSQRDLENMNRIVIKPAWVVSSEGGDVFEPHLFALLRAIHQNGTLTAAAEAVDISYRHAWDLLQKWRGIFGSDVVAMRQRYASAAKPVPPA